MWREHDEIIQDLGSKDGRRIEAALADLRAALDGLEEEPLPRLEVPRILHALGAPPPPSALRDLVRLVEGYPSFDPPMTPQERAQALSEIVLITGDQRAALETNLYIKAHPELLPSILDGLAGQLGRPGAVAHIGRLVSYLLLAKPELRASVVETLRTPPWREVHAWLLPELDQDER